MSNENGRYSRRKRTSARSFNVDHVDVNEIFTFTGESGEPVGDGCYINTTINNKRYYGVLISQESLKEASELHFQDEAASLALNTRMVNLRKNHSSFNLSTQDENDEKYDREEVQVQKFKYVEANAKTLGYRVILATYANVREAARDKNDLFQQIKSACDKGGDWVGKYYYQYETPRNSLKPVDLQSTRRNEGLLHTSMSFNSFLFNTSFPSWYPLKNSVAGRAKILNMLNLKTDKNGGIVKYNSFAEAPQNTSMVTTSRSNFRVGIVGAGLAGLGCAQELLRLSKRKNMHLEVFLYEARDRVGGRCSTDYTTFKTASGRYFPIEVGANWIHGTTGNPLAILAQAAGTKMRGASENVKLLVGEMKEADAEMDSRISNAFDNILDSGAEKCWNRDEGDLINRIQKTTRFYASLLQGDGVEIREENRCHYQKDVAPYRFSSDVSVQVAIQEALSQNCANFTPEEKQLLNWNIKHAEYSFGANIDDLSMKYWDADDEYAFKGKHVLLREGYSTIASAVLAKCKESGDKFKLFLEHPVEKIEYDLKCYSRADKNGTNSTIGVSDTCRVTGGAAKISDAFDFVVCALPLGVLKSSIDEKSKRASVAFEPPLPQTKVDSIEHVGFGILNKIFIQFPHSFWRKPGSKEDLKGTVYLSDSDNNFGNASTVNPQHYMFFDVGFDPEKNSSEDPHILHTLVSGMDAIRGEKLSDQSIIEEVMCTLRHLFSDLTVPQPIAYKISRWGSDEFSQGAYSFLPPGSSDQDYFSLQSSVCSDGDIFSVGDKRIMRLFFAGEHTSAHYPSLAHGAYISGVRAARDILHNIEGNKDKTAGGESVVPMTRYRMKYPNAPLRCQLCGLQASDKEGELKVFQKDKKLVIVHKNCAEFSPEVSIKNGVWFNVMKSINRGRQLRCVRCKKNGATIGCNEKNCKENYHFGCCDSSWKFEVDGKGYFCEKHRKQTMIPQITPSLHRNQSKDVPKSKSQGGKQSFATGIRSPTMEYKSLPLLAYRFKRPTACIKCALCGKDNVTDITGPLIYLTKKNGNGALLHENCIKLSNLMETTIIEPSNTVAFVNVFETIQAARTCFKCHKDGATICCKQPGCFRHFHLTCIDVHKGQTIYCLEHRNTKVAKSNPSNSKRTKTVLVESKCFKVGSSLLSHDLFYEGAQKHYPLTVQKVKKRAREYAPSNEFEPRPKMTDRQFFEKGDGARHVSIPQRPTSRTIANISGDEKKSQTHSGREMIDVNGTSMNAENGLVDSCDKHSGDPSIITDVKSSNQNLLPAKMTEEVDAKGAEISTPQIMHAIPISSENLPLQIATNNFDPKEVAREIVQNAGVTGAGTSTVSQAISLGEKKSISLPVIMASKNSTGAITPKAIPEAIGENSKPGDNPSLIGNAKYSNQNLLEGGIVQKVDSKRAGGNEPTIINGSTMSSKNPSVTIATKNFNQKEAVSVFHKAHVNSPGTSTSPRTTNTGATNSKLPPVSMHFSMIKKLRPPASFASNDPNEGGVESTQKINAEEAGRSTVPRAITVDTTNPGIDLNANTFEENSQKVATERRMDTPKECLATKSTAPEVNNADSVDTRQISISSTTVTEVSASSSQKIAPKSLVNLTLSPTQSKGQIVQGGGLDANVRNINSLEQSEDVIDLTFSPNDTSDASSAS